MATIDPIRRYKGTEVGTAQQGRLILMMYDGAIRFLRQARMNAAKRDIAGRASYLCKAIDVISALNLAIDENKGGEIATNLRHLYIFLNNHLTRANMEEKIELVDDAVAILSTLREGWDGIVNRPSAIPRPEIRVENTALNPT